MPSDLVWPGGFWLVLKGEQATAAEVAVVPALTLLTFARAGAVNAVAVGTGALPSGDAIGNADLPGNLLTDCWLLPKGTTLALLGGFCSWMLV